MTTDTMLRVEFALISLTFVLLLLYVRSLRNRIRSIEDALREPARRAITEAFDRLRAKGDRP
jgi:hypothetical protein